MRAFHPEDIARSAIDARLVTCGWLVQSRDEMNLSAGAGVAVREFATASGPVDYALFVDKRFCGVVEAKPAGTTLSGFSEQAACMGLLLSSDFRAAISLSCFLDQFLCSTWNPVSSPRPAVLQSRRAQELSRLAVAPTLRRTPALPGHTLTASSTTAGLMSVGTTIRGGLAIGRGSSRHNLVFGRSIAT